MPVPFALLLPLLALTGAPPGPSSGPATRPAESRPGRVVRLVTLTEEVAPVEQEPGGPLVIDLRIPEEIARQVQLQETDPRPDAVYVRMMPVGTDFDVRLAGAVRSYLEITGPLVRNVKSGWRADLHKRSVQWSDGEYRFTGAIELVLAATGQRHWFDLEVTVRLGAGDAKSVNPLKLLGATVKWTWPGTPAASPTQ